MFEAGDTAAKTIKVPTTDDDDIEPIEEKFILKLSGTYDGDFFEKEVLGTILENDRATVTMTVDPGFTVFEGQTVKLTFELSEALPYIWVLNILDMRHETATKQAGDGGATEADYTFPSSNTHFQDEIPIGHTSLTVSIPIVNDEVAEPDETVELSFSSFNRRGQEGQIYNRVNFSNNDSTSINTTLTITDDDKEDLTSGQRVVHLHGGTGMTQVALTEGDSTNITATIVGDAPSSNISIPLKITEYPSDEFAMGDYSIPEEITIRSGEKSGFVRLKTKNNSKDDRYHRLLSVEINDTKLPSDYTSGDRNRFEVVIEDNDKTNVSLQSPSRTSLSEDASQNMPKDLNVEFKISMGRKVAGLPLVKAPFVWNVEESQPKFVLKFSNHGLGQARHGIDYNIPGTISPPANCTQWDDQTCTVVLTVVNDNLHEGNEMAVISLNANTNVQDRSDTFNDLKPTGEGLKLTIIDDDPQPMLAIGDATVREGGKLSFTVTRTGARGNALSVKAATAADETGTHPATAGSDYSTITRTLNFQKNELEQTFEVTTTDDSIDEPGETFLVKLSSPKDTGGNPDPGIADETATGTITDNDDAPMELKITVDTNTSTDDAETTIAEAAGETDVKVTATITSPTRFSTAQMVTITVGKSGDGAAEVTDYQNVPDNIKITIPAEQASGTTTFKLTPVNDSFDEDDETISVEGALSDMTVTHAVITIEDDDTRSITVDPVTLTLDEADDTSTMEDKENEKTYEVALTSQPEGGTVTVNITNPGPTVATVDPSSLTFDADNWETAQTVTVIAKDDTIDDTGDQKTTTISHTVSADGTDYKDEKAEDVAVTVRDDDEAPTALTITVDTDTGTDGDQGEISEGASSPTVRITATLDGDTQFATDKKITITVGDSDEDTATEGTGGDYNTVNNFDITLSAGEESVSHDLTLTLNDDSVDEPDETVTISGELAGVTVNDTMFTIEDNDDTPTVMLVLTPASINESGATNASTITATMDGKSSEAVTLEVSATPVTPAVAGDFTLSDTTTLTIPANTEASTGTVTITAVDNKVDAADKTVTVAATATGGNALVQAPGNQTLTIKDDDTRGITVSKATLTLDEEDNTATTDVEEDQGTYTVVLNSEPSGGTVTIGVVSGGTAVATVAPATLTFTASNWNVPQTVTVTAMPDDIDNPNDRRAVAITHTVTATGTDYDGATASGVTVTVNDDDGAPTLSINSPSVTEVDSGATATLTFTVRLTPESGNTVTVAYADAGTGTATSGDTDYATLDGGTLTFAPSETMKTVAVTVRGDDLDEPDETVVVRLSSPSNATLTGGATTLDGTGTINDNDATPTVSVADATAVSEGDVAAPDPPNNMTFTVTLSAASGRTVTVPYTLSGTATAGTDYTEPNSRSVTIAAGRTGADIEIPVAGDEVDEENETITVTLGTPINATVSTAEGAGAASGTITDDDTRGVSVTPTVLTVAEADNTGTAATREDQETYKVVLTSEPTGAVTVNLKSGDESVARIDTASLVFDTDDWNTERTVTVTGQADVIDNANDRRTTNITHTVSAAGTDYADETAKNVAVTVTDDDAAPSGITLTASPDSVTENSGAKTITVTAAVNGATRYAEARTVSVSVGGGTAISGTDYTAVESFDITIGAGEDDASNTFTLTPENDVLAEGNETIDVTGTLSGITITPDEITLTDDDAVPSGITLSVDTNGAEDGTPSTVAEDAGATVVTVTATVNGETRYVEAKTVAVSVADGTAESPADYAAVSNFNITIAAGAASHTGSFTVTPVDDDLDEPNETIDVTGTLTDITITGAMVTLTDNDDPVSFSIADAEATEGGKVIFTVSRAGAGDNVASVKVTTATDSGDGANAADADDYTAITTAQTLNFAKDVTSQMVEVQTTQDDLFEMDETFLVNLSAPALADGDPGTDVSIESGKGTATGTIKNDDTEPSFAVADASASEGNGITFTVTRSGAMDNAVSVKWNTKAGTASTTDYTPVTTAQTLTFAKGVGSQTFTVATTEDVLAEGDETFLVELTGAEGGTIATAEATGTITDDDAAPTGITLSVDADTGTNNVQSSIAEEGGVKTVRVTATIDGRTRFATEQTVTVTVGKDGDSATEGTDYSMVGQQSIEIPIGAASGYVDFPLTPTTDVLFEGSETISLEGTLTGVAFTNTAITITDDDAAPSAITLSVDADTGTNNVQSSIAEEGGVKTVRVTATITSATRFATEQTVTVTVGKDGDSATEGKDYSMVGEQNIEIPIGAASAHMEFMLTPTTDVLFEGSETISLEGTLTGVTFTNSSITITDDDAAPSAITLSVDTNAGGNGTPTNVGEGATATTVRVTATITSTTRFATEQTVTVKVGKDGDSAKEGTDYALVADQSIKIPAGAASGYVDFSLTPTQDVLDESDETISVDGELTGVTFTPATITINDDDAAPEFITLSVDTNAGGDGTPTSVGEEAGATTVRVTATITSASRFEANQAVTFEVGKSGDTATEGEDYAEVDTLTITIDGGEASGYVDFTLTPTSDVLDEPNETISVHGTQANITFTDATITITDDDDTPSGITLSVDTNGSTSGTPNTVAEGAGATVVTVTATVNGETRYVDAKTVAVSVDDNTAASPADYAAVSNFNITIAAGAASHTGVFTVTPVDDNLDESDETIDVTGTLTDITITGATVTFTDNDDPVSFSIADAEATEGGKVIFTVSRTGAQDNVASVKIATAADSGDGVKAAGTDDYTAIATAKTLNFAKGVTIQTVEVQTTQDDLFEPDETFKAVLSAPALADGDPGTRVSIESGKGTATGTIKNDDTQPSFAVADASASEGDAITFTVTRSGAMDNAVSVKWNTKTATGAGAASASDYTESTTATKLDFAKGVSSQTFTVATTEDVLHEGNETFLIELTGAEGGTITTAQATGTITDDDTAPSGITLSVDTNGSTSGTPNTVAEGAGATVVTVTATVNGETRYVDAKTVAVSVDDNTAASPADYAAVSNFNITIAAGAASHTGSFTVTPVDDDLDEANETIDVTGTLSNITVTGATVTLTDNDDPVSFSIADAEATEGGKVTFTVSRGGAGDNVASVKVATEADSDADANAAGTDDYTAIATAQTLNFAKGVTSQTVEVQTTQDDLFEPDETFKAVLSAPALADGDPGTGVSIESGKGTATGTIKNDDTQPSFAVADTSASEGDAITFTVTRSGAMDNAVSVKWNTKTATGAGAASASDYTESTTAMKLDFAKGVGSQTFTVATTEDTLHEGDETFLVELTDAVGAAITDAEATGTITDDDAAPTTLTLTVDADTGTMGTQTSLAEDGGAKTVRVTATLVGSSTFTEAKTVTVDVGVDADSATEGADYATVAQQSITIDAGKSSGHVDFTLTPTQDVLHEGSETISLDGTLTDVTVTDATITLTDDDTAPTGITLSVSPATVGEGAGETEITVTATVNGTTRYVEDKTVTVSVGGGTATSATDYDAVANFDIIIAAGDASKDGTFDLTPTQDDLHEGSETIDVTGTSSPITVTKASITLEDNDAQPSFAVADASAAEGEVITFTVTRSGAMDNAVSVKWKTKVATGAGAASASDYTASPTAMKLDFAKGVGSQTFTVATTEDTLHEGDETFLVELTDAVGAAITDAEATGTITDDDAAPTTLTLTVDADTGTMGTQTSLAEDGGAKTVRVTATLVGSSTFTEAKTVTVDVGVDADSATEGADYTTVAQQSITIDAGKSSGHVDFTLTPMQDVLAEGSETISLDGTLTDVTVTDATITLTDDDTAPTGITLSVSPAMVGEGASETEITVTATVNGTTRYAEDKTVTVSVGGGSATSATDYDAVANFDIIIAAGDASKDGTFDLTPTQDDLHEGSETIDVTGTSSPITVTKASISLTDDDGQPSFAVADASAAEGDAITFTVTRSGAMDNAVSVKWNTKTATGAGAASASDYTESTTAMKLDFAKGVGSQTFTVATTEDTLHEGDETFLVELTDAVGAAITDAEATGTITDDDAAPTTLTLTVDADTGTMGTQTSLAEDGGAKTVRVTATLVGSSTFTEAKTVTVDVGVDADSATEGADYATVAQQSITIDAGKSSGHVDFTLTPTQDVLHEGSETISLDGTLTDVTVTDATITLTDDDTAPTGITLSVSPATVGEGAGETEITVTATVNGTTRYVEDKTVTVSVGGGTATSATDYDAVANFDIIIAAGDASKDGTFDLTPTQDDLHEGSETIDVTGTSSPITVTKASITLEDNDAQPSFAVADASAAEGEVITFTVTRSGAMDNAVSVKWKTKVATGAGAASASDYTASPTAMKLDFAKGVGSQTFTVATTEDTLHEGDETFLVELTDAVGAAITDAEATGTITDDDAAPTTLTLTVDADTGTMGTQTSLAEDGGAKTVRVTATLVGSSTFTEAKTVTVDVGVDADSATEGADYATVAQQSITIDAGKSSGHVDFTLTPTQDVLHEGSETISLDGTLTDVTVTDATITLTDDDTAPTGITLSVSPATVGEGAGETEITVTATVNGTTRYVEDKTVTVSVGGGTATSATDYDAVANFDIIIAAGDASKDGTFDLTPTQDDLHEGSETIDVTGTSSPITVTKASITLEDNDAQPSFAVADASAAEGEVITFTVTRSGAMDNAVSVKWNTKVATGAGAASASDYTASPTAMKLDFAKGVGSQTFTVATTEDTLHEGDETFLVELTDAVGAAITDAEATGTITDDDAAPTTLTLTVDADTGTMGTQTSLAEDGGAKTVRVTATLVGSSTFTEAKTVTVDVGVDADSATEGADYTTVAQQSITIDAGKSSGHVDFTLTPMQDVLAEGSETISLDGTLTDVTVTDATITLTDDDTAPTGITLSVSPAMVGEGASETEITVTATVNGTTRYAEDKTVTVSVGGGSATSATDYDAVANFDIIIAAGDASKDGTFDLTPTQDDLHEGSETIDVTGTSSPITVTKASISLTDDDGQPSFAVADASAAEGEVITFTVTRSGAMDNAVSVKWNTKVATGAGAASASDYTASPTAMKLDFAKGVGSQTFTVATTEDTLHEGDETFLVELTDAVGAAITDAEATGTITDDDAAPTTLTLTVDADTGTMGTQTSLAEDGGAKTVRVTATLVGSSTFTEAKTVTVDVGVDADSATEGADYTTVAQQSITIDAGKSSGHVDFTLTPMQDVLAEGSETISLDGTLTDVTVTDATITLTDDDTAPTGITLSVSPAMVGEGASETEITVTATVNGTTRYAEDKTVTVSVGGGSATSATDYDAVANFDIIIAAGDASKDGTFDLTPTQDDLHEGSETIDVTGTSSPITVTKASISLTDDDGQPSFAVADASAAEGEVITFTVTRSGAMDNAVSVKWNTKVATGAGAASASDYTASPTAMKLDFAKGVGSQTFTVATTEDTLHEGDETFLVELTDAVGAAITDAEATGTITDDDAAPTTLTLTVDADTGTMGTQTSLAEDGGAKTVRVTATLVGSSTFTEAKTVTVDVGVDADSATEGADYTTVAQQSITIDAGKSSGHVDFTLTPMQDVLAEGSETISLDGTLTDVTVTDATITLTDDDTAPTGITLSVSPAMVGEGASETEITVTATVNGTTRYAEDKTVTVSVGGGSATSATDYDAVANFDIIIAAGDASKDGTFDLTPTQDDLHEGSETIDVTGTSSPITVTKASISLTDDDGQPSFAVADASAAEGEVITFTVTRSGAMDNAVSVKWNTKVATGAGAASASDYTASPTAMKLDFAKGVGSQTFTVATTEDTLHEGDETFLVELTDAVGAAITDAEATGTITDDDAAPTTLTLTVDADTGTMGTQTSLAEDGGAKTVRVTATLVGSSTFTEAKTVTVDVGVDADSATEGADYTTVAQQSITIDAGKSSGHVDFTLTPMQDVLAEGSETISLDGTLTDVTVTDATITLTDDDTAPTGITLSVSPAMVGEGASETEITVTATVNGTTRYAEDKTVTVSVGGGSATSATDYDAVANFDIIIAAGDASKDGTFDLTPTQDDLHEGSETIDVTGTSSPITVTKASITLTDDDGQPSFAVADASAAEGEVITFTVTRSGAMDNAVSVKWNTKVATGAGAASASDYTASPTAMKLDFAKGVGSQTFTVATTEDTLHEGDETFLVELTDAVGAAITDAEATGTITDDDAAPTTLTLTVDADTGTMGTQTSLAEDGGAKTVRVTATLVGSSTFTEAKTVTVDVGVDADSATEGADYATVAQQSITIDAGKSSGHVDFTLTPMQDVLAEGSETISLDGTLTDVTVTDATITLTDDDTAPTGITLSVSPAMVGEGASETEITVTATVNGTTRYAEDKTVTVSVGGGSATSATDYDAVANFDIIIAAGDASKDGTFDLTPTQDDLHEGSETIDVTGTSSPITVTKASISLTDDDGQPSFAVADASAAEGEVITFTVTRSGAMDNAVSVKWNTKVATGAGAASASDYTASPTAMKLDFAKGVGSQTFTVATTEDTLHEGDETFLVELTDAVGAAITDAEATGTITDDEGTPTVTLVLTPSTINESGTTNTSTVTATLSGASNVAVTLTVAAAAGANTDAADFTLSTNKTLTIAAGATTSAGAVTITAVDNSVNAPDKTVTVSATASGGGVANPANQTLTITDDDTNPPTALTITVDTDSNTAGNQNSIGENAGAPMVTVTATLDGTSRFGVNKDVTVKIGKDSDTAVEGTDYEEVGDLTVRINAGDASGSKTFTLTLTDDVIDEQDETISVEGTLETLAVTHDSITITDADEPPSGLTITVDTDPVKEGNQDSVDEDAVDGTRVKVTATLNGASRFGVDKDVIVKIGKDSDTAVEGTDYVTDYVPVEGLTVTINAGEASGNNTFMLTPINDGIDEDNETISVEGDLTGLPKTYDSITITDDDEAPSGFTITVDTDLDTDGDQDSVDEDAEDGTRVRVTATLDGTSRFAASQTVTVSVGGGTATSGTDYEKVPGFNITIVAGEASGSNTFTLILTDDKIHEGDETINVTGTLGLGSLDPAKATIIITDNDAAPTGLRISVDTGSPENLGSSTRNLSSERDRSLLYEDAKTTTTVTVTATLDGTSRFSVDQTVIVTVGADSDTAEEGRAIWGTDYTAVPSFKITIGADAKSGTSTFDITPIDDKLAEGDETINLEGTLTGITVTGTTITITDDDTAPTGITLTVDPASVGEEDGKPEITVKAAVNGATRYTKAKTVTVSVGGGTATSETDYEEVPGFDITIGAGAESATHTFTLILIDDKIHEGDETINVTGTSGSLTVTDATLTIEDDEELPVVSINSPSVKESGKSGVPTEMTFTVTIFPESTKLVTVSYADTGTGTATEDKDYVSPGTGILTFAPGITRRRIAITVKGDNIDEYDETVVLRLSNPTNATLPDNVAALESTGTIIDNNEPPTVSLLDSEPVEEGEVAVFPVRLSGESGKPITVSWKTSSGTALEDVDYHGGSEQITIHAGTVEKTVEITTIDDREIEDWTENFSVALSGLVNVTPESIKATGIIKDDDRPAAIERLERVNKTILPYVGSAIMRSRIDHVTGCIRHAASGVAYGDLSSFEGQLRNNADILDQHQMERISFLDVFNDARFASGFKAYEEKHNPGDVTFCAGSDWNELSGGDNDPVTWDGSLAGTHLGGNVRISEWILTGLDLFLYTGSFDWKDEGGEEEFRGIEGEWNLNIRGVNPYVALLSEDGETQFWTMAGYGFGRVDIEEEILDQSADITMKSVALGGAVPLRKGSGNVSLSLRGDLWLGEFEIAENGDLINGVSVQTRGARALLESTWHRGSITPSLLVGVKHDNSSSDSTGMEIGSGIEWGSSSHGLRVSLKSRALLVRSSVQEWGVSGDVNLSPRDGLGPSLRLTTSRGDAEERASTFLEDDSETLLGESGEGGISFEAEAGWGISAAGGRGTMTPFAGVALLERDERVLRLGGRLDMGKTLDLQLEGQREKNEINGSEYGLLLEAKFSF